MLVYYGKTTKLIIINILYRKLYRRDIRLMQDTKEAFDILGVDSNKVNLNVLDKQAVKNLLVLIDSV